MYNENRECTLLHLSEKESAQLALAVQILIHELGFEPEDVDRAYNESFAYFINDDHYPVDQNRIEKHQLIEQPHIST